VAGRIYSLTFAAVAVAAVQDFFQISAASNVAIIIHEWQVGTEATVSETVRVRMARATAGTVTGSPVLRPHDAGSPVADSNMDINDTTQLTVGDIHLEDYMNLVTGFHHLPTPEDRIKIPGGGLYMISMQTAPGASTLMSGRIVIEESG